MTFIVVSCPCGARFRVPESLKGGLANCTGCGKATTVEGGPEPLFWALLAAGAATVLGIAAAVWAFGGLLAGGITLGVGVLILGAIVLAS